MRKKSIGIGLMGLGVIGGQVARVLTDKAELLAEQVGCPLVLKKIKVSAPVALTVVTVKQETEIKELPPEKQEIERLGHRIAVVHGHQWGSPKVHDLAEAFQDFSAVIYGHTHIPLVEKTAGPLVVNPGSAGHQRFGKPVTAAVLTLKRDVSPEAKLFDLVG